MSLLLIHYSSFRIHHFLSLIISDAYKVGVGRELFVFIQRVRVGLDWRQSRLCEGFWFRALAVRALFVVAVYHAADVIHDAFARARVVRVRVDAGLRRLLR